MFRSSSLAISTLLLIGMNTNCLSEYDSERNQREWELAKQRGEANRLNLERKEQPKIESYIHKDGIEEFER